MPAAELRDLVRGRDAVVVGSGPNGLSAAITLAAAGRSVTVVEAAETLGGGSRSAELTEPGFVHDVCSTVHALALKVIQPANTCPCGVISVKDSSSAYSTITPVDSFILPGMAMLRSATSPGSIPVSGP